MFMRVRVNDFATFCCRMQQEATANWINQIYARSQSDWFGPIFQHRATGYLCAVTNALELQRICLSGGHLLDIRIQLGWLTLDNLN